jgi:hypothetical protein
MDNKKSFEVILLKESDLEEKLVKEYLEKMNSESEISFVLRESFKIEIEEDLLVPGVTGKKLGLIRINKFLNQMKEKGVDCENWIILSITEDILENYLKKKLIPQEISYAVFYYNDNLIFAKSDLTDLDPETYLDIIAKQDTSSPDIFINFFLSKIKKIKPLDFDQKNIQDVIKEDIQRIHKCLKNGFTEVTKVLLFLEDN